ncbi:MULTISPECIES: sulfurtransferase complex subunit TusB [Photorhabdus]|uniref:Protein TusB n=2 Tax=Photorhabdus TaxID=29487 RepID=A0ABX0AZV3_9GAMM|nr:MULTISPECIES: sulfurtransferase complex subunit TusB [Photorhabdus]MCC8374647.1 sulfurtransferase complex subunit TusB [Photorhabdus bodei]MCC8464423.1 sulfurtransferase complex subunit TusB [Photorhabdus bodei]MCT8353496.1 sulfurtransferase complex subunit TusB [Photorhabdus kayaii]MDB6369130.1 sulfurtransferase complex subunit TusB [Photorhabdus bodei]MDB6372195.1 sulfurtransferase complex subunit TusB [Photorhabdus bodei]
MLYTVGRSPYQCDFNVISKLLASGDDILFIQDGVLAGIEGNCYLPALISRGATLYALKEDIEARGLGDQVSDKVQVIDYTDFVNLTVKHHQQFAW